MDPWGLSALNSSYYQLNVQQQLNAAAINAAWIRLGNPAAGNAMAQHQAMLLALYSLLAQASNGNSGSSSGPIQPGNASSLANSTSQTANGLAGPSAGPPAAFQFSCKPIPPEQVPGLVAKGTLIGVDPNYEGSQATIDAVKRAGGRLHVYREGPGGETGSKGWDREELGRSQAAAAKYGGMKNFMAGGWRQHTLEQLKKDKANGFESAEVDNIPESQLLPFYREYAAEFRKGTLPKLMMKNLSAEQIQAVRAAGLPREMFADFAIWESSGGSGAAGAQALQQMGIKQITSTDTYNYSARG